MTISPATIAPELSPRLVRGLENQVRGEVVRPGDARYERARQVWNATVDRYPALIVRPRNARDVGHAIAFARGNDLPLAVRGGGHGVAGQGVVDGGIVVDLSLMTRLELDPARRVAWADAGLTWGEFVARAHGEGLATPGPDVGAVSLGGSTLAGGFGWLSRQYGMTIDNLRAVEVVTAGGQLLTASDEENGDLFWALRGGGGNFGVATRLQLQLHPVDTVVGGALVYPASRAVVRDYVAAAAAAPDALTTITFIMQAPPLPFIPSHAHGTPVFFILPCFTGDLATSDRVYAPLRSLGGHAPLADTIAPMPYPALFEMAKAGADRKPVATRAGLMDDIDDATIDALLDAMSRATSPFGQIMLRVLGGEVVRVPAEATAFSHRDKSIYIAVTNAWADVTDPLAGHHVAWTETLWQALAPRTAGAYTGFLGDEGPERVRAAFAPASFARLAEVKRRYDPDNIFRQNANIEPA